MKADSFIEFHVALMELLAMIRNQCSWGRGGNETSEKIGAFEIFLKAQKQKLSRNFKN